MKNLRSKFMYVRCPLCGGELDGDMKCDCCKMQLRGFEFEPGAAELSPDYDMWRDDNAPVTVVNFEWVYYGEEGVIEG